MNPSQALAWVGLFITVMLAIGAGLALIRGSFNKARIEALRGDNSDLRDRVADLEHENERHELKEGALETRCEHLESENKLLMEMVTQRAEVAEVKGMLDRHHKEAMKKFDELIAVSHTNGMNP